MSITRKGSEVDIGEMSEDEAKKIVLEDPLPKARWRTNIVSDDYIPERRLFGAYATRGEGALKLLLDHSFACIACVLPLAFFERALQTIALRASEF